MSPNISIGNDAPRRRLLADDVNKSAFAGKWRKGFIMAACEEGPDDIGPGKKFGDAI